MHVPHRWKGDHLKDFYSRKIKGVERDNEDEMNLDTLQLVDEIYMENKNLVIGRKGA